MNIEGLIKKVDKLSSTIDALETAITSIQHGKGRNGVSTMAIRVFIDSLSRDAIIDPDLLLSALNEQLKLVQAEREPLKKKIEAINLMLESN